MTAGRLGLSYVKVSDSAMPDSPDVAVQRKRIEELQRHGQSTQEAEARLRAMLEAATWRSQAVDPMLHFKRRVHDQRFCQT
jgi:hypothetical protein